MMISLAMYCKGFTGQWDHPQVYCQADDAILCRPCDTRIHSANKLASRHIRVELNRRPNGPLGSCPDHSGAEADMYCTDARWKISDVERCVEVWQGVM